MTLMVGNINSNYFISNRDINHNCSICYETPAENHGRLWIAHENPYSSNYPILTRSLFLQYIHPMHEDCYAQLKKSSNNCPECRAVICKEGEVLEDHVFVDEEYWTEGDFISEDEMSESESSIEPYTVFGSSESEDVDEESSLESDLSESENVDEESEIESDSVHDDESEIEAVSVVEASAVYVDDENDSIYHTLSAIEGLYSHFFLP